MGLYRASWKSGKALLSLLEGSPLDSGCSSVAVISVASRF